MPDATESWSLKRVVIVDDSRSFIVLLRTVLWEFGFRDIVEFEQPQAALDYMRAASVDVAFVDLMMPGLNGFRLAELIRHSGDVLNRAMPIIMITGHADRRSIQSAINHGIDEVLVKPIRPKHVFQRLSGVLERPRVYIKTPGGYFGPDRRRRQDPGYRGPERRQVEDHEVFTGSGFVHARSLRAEQVRVGLPSRNGSSPPWKPDEPDNDVFLLD